MERTCEQCGKGFVGWAGWKPNRFCSGACYHAWRPGRTRAQLADKRPPEERACLVCGKLFIVGGRGGRARSTKACSTACAQASRYNHGAVARQMSVAEAAYVAGIIDGEGSIILQMRRDVVALLVSVTNTDRRLLRWLHEAVGVGSVCAQAKETTIRKATAFWRCSGDAADSVLRQVQPYLVAKRVQCDLALDTIARLRVPHLKADRSWHREWRDKMCSLNRRGPVQTTPVSTPEPEPAVDEMGELCRRVIAELDAINAAPPPEGEG